MKAFSLNLLVTFVWILLQSDPSGFGFFSGYLLGFALIALFRGVLGAEDYVRRTVAAAVFSWIFMREFVLSCVQLVRAVLFTPVSRLRPSIILYDIEGLTRLEALLLSHCISLTPGTTTVKVSPDFRQFTLHILDGDPDEVRASIDRTLKRGILAFTR